MFDRFRSLSTRQQILLVGFAVIGVSLLLGSAWYLLLRTTYEPLFTGLRPTDAATIVADLERKKIAYELADGGATILVSSDVADRTRLNVMTEDLPLKGTVGFELFNKTDMGLTDFAQKINYQRALQGELERTIMTLDGIEVARVHLSLGEDRIFRDDRVPPKASVTIRMQHGQTLPLSAAQGIQRLIAAAVPNLDSANVVILDAQGRVIAAAPHVQAPVSVASPFAQEKRAIEQYYEARVRQALGSADPQDAIGVAVNANVAAAADGHVDAAQTLAGWNPGARSFPLQVTLSPPPELVAVSQDTLHNVVAGAIGSDAAKNDAIVFGPAVESAEPVPADTPQPVAVAKNPVLRTVYTEPEETRSWSSTVSFGLLALLLVGGLYVVLRQLRRARRLTEAQRADFAARLRVALEQGESHVASRP